MMPYLVTTARKSKGWPKEQLLRYDDVVRKTITVTTMTQIMQLLLTNNTMQGGLIPDEEYQTKDAAALLQ